MLVRPHDGGENNLPPVQMMLCYKQQNSKKINSLRWLFNAFGRILNPEICIILDAGTKPGAKALLSLWEAFYNDKDLGGACGEVHVMKGKGLAKLCNPLVAAQNFEYKIASLLDRSFESAFGYLTVLPGCFSAYRYRAIRGHPLQQYFYGDQTLSQLLGKKGIEGMNIFKKNMFLADDRILAFELISKTGSKWRSVYVRGSRAETDIPEGTVDFINQRRRWLNGTFAATCYSVMNFLRVYRSGHGIIRTAFFHVQLIYSIVSLFLAWFSLAAFLLTTFVIMDISSSPPPDSNIRAFPFGSATATFNAVLQFIYLCTVVLVFIVALGNRPRGEVYTYIFAFVFFAFMQFYFILNVVYLLIVLFRSESKDGTGPSYDYVKTFYSSVGTLTIKVSCASIFGTYYAISFLFLDPWHMFTSYPQYLFIASSYTNILNVFAFSNWHDVTWGTKGAKPEAILPSAITEKRGEETFLLEDDRPQADIDSRFESAVKRALKPYKPAVEVAPKLLDDSFKSFRTKLISVYIFSNFMLCVFVMNDSFGKLKFLVCRLRKFKIPSSPSHSNRLVTGC
jgi:chitin synthase